MTYFPTHIHSVGSLLDGIIKVDELIDRCKELGFKACSISDHGNVSLAYSFISECNKNDIKPIVGNELYICSQHSSIRNEENRKLEHMVVLAKNKDGWRNLVRITSESNDYSSYYYKPRLSLEEIKPFSDNLFAFSGHAGSSVGNALMKGGVLDAQSEEEGDSLITQEMVEDAKEKAKALVEIFGDRFFLEIQLFDKDRSPGFISMAKALRKIGKELGIKCVACIDAHYLRPEDAEIQRIALCSSLKLKLNDVNNKIAKGEPTSLSSFFKSDRYFVQSIEELLECGNTQEEIDNVSEIGEMCESYTLDAPPELPKFDRDIEDEYEYLLELCRQGWNRRYNNTWDKEVYGNRVKKEMRVIKRTNLSSYFLIVADYINYMKVRGWLVGPGRGSSAGSLVAYLIGITEVDPIKNDLIFERFFNQGRCYTKHINFDEYKYLEDFNA